MLIESGLLQDTGGERRRRIFLDQNAQRPVYKLVWNCTQRGSQIVSGVFIIAAFHFPAIDFRQIGSETLFGLVRSRKLGDDHPYDYLTKE